MPDRDPPGLQHYPMPMARFGQNCFGENLYRIVLTGSRLHLVGGEWPDGARGYQWVPKYRQVAAGWILEAWGWANMPKREWENLTDPISGWPVLGPYPARGEYEMAWEFDQGVGNDNVEKIIAAIEYGRQRSYSEVRQFHKSEYEQEERDSKREARDEITDCITAFGNAPISFGKYGRGTKTVPELRSAEELGLRVPRAAENRNPADLRGLDVTSTLLAGRV